MSTEPGGLPQAAIELLGQCRANRQNAYRLRWKGTNIPRGASVYLGRPSLHDLHNPTQLRARIR